MSAPTPQYTLEGTAYSDGSFTGKWSAAAPPPPPPPPPGALAGATVNGSATEFPGCQGGALDTCVAGKFDSFVSTGLSAPIAPAMTIQKGYLVPDDLPSSLPAHWTAYHAAGGKLLVSIKPSKAFSTATDAAFKATVEAIVKDLGADAKLILWQEPNTTKSGFTAEEYHAYVAHYAPIVRAVSADLALVYDPALAANGDTADAASVTAFYPGDQFADEVYADYYGTSYNGGARLDCLTNLADAHAGGPVPVGVGEWGVAAVTDYVFDAAAFDAYTTYLSEFVKARAGAGKPVGWVLYWASGPNNMVSASNSPIIPGLQKVCAGVGAA